MKITIFRYVMLCPVYADILEVLTASIFRSEDYAKQQPARSKHPEDGCSNIPLKYQ
jgi:hypothetical protein